MEAHILKSKLNRELTDEEANAVLHWNQNGAGISPEKWEEMKEIYASLCEKADVELDRDPLASYQDKSIGNFRLMLLIAFCLVVLWTLVTFFIQETTLR